MTPLKSSRWRGDFLRALSRSANVALAAHEAGIDRTAPYYQRRRNPVFARDWDRALEAGKRSLEKGGVPPRPSSRRDDRPRVVSRSGDGRPRLIRPAGNRWNEDKEKRFFEVLMETANITAACEAVGIATASVHARCRRWPAFAALVRETCEWASASLNLKLIHAGSVTLSPLEMANVDTPLVSIDQAIKIVQMNLPEMRFRYR